MRVKYLITFCFLLILASCNSSFVNKNKDKEAKDYDFELFLNLRRRLQYPEQEDKYYLQTFIPDEMEYSEFEKLYDPKYRTLNLKFYDDTFEVAEYKDIVLKKDSQLIKITAKNWNAKSNVFINSFATFDYIVSGVEIDSLITPEKITAKHIGQFVKSPENENNIEFQDDSWKQFWNNQIGEVLFVNKDLMVCAIDKHYWTGGANSTMTSELETFYLDSLNMPLLFTEFINNTECSGSPTFGLIRFHGKWTARKRCHFSSIGPSYSDYLTKSVLNPEVIGFDELPMDWKIIKQKFPDAVDAFMSPDKSWFFVMSKTELKAFKIKDNQVGDIAIEIPLLTNECIVGINW